MENKLFELAAARRSVRKYTGEPVPEEILREIMKVALGGKAEDKPGYTEEDFDFGKVHLNSF